MFYIRLGHAIGSTQDLANVVGVSEFGRAELAVDRAGQQQRVSSHATHGDRCSPIDGGAGGRGSDSRAVKRVCVANLVDMTWDQIRWRRGADALIRHAIEWGRRERGGGYRGIDCV